ncbi:type II toxin-antitoxin system RelE/ParE family toxin [Siccibacter colletis]|uniref:type II toxin-antitoxin system RelE/ParE family toxin n=1 Tax=Siccibacter colletis TaxID=1505757 RepID=UPI0004E16C62|nr:type II toxin-antitoxin system RelE/ParE family toxin [Siccibacter colletis]
MLKSIEGFREKWLSDFFHYSKPDRRIPKDIESSLHRKLDILNAAASHRDLRSPPGNRYEQLNPPLDEYSSIRVNEKYRLIFKWIDGKASDIYLDPHKYSKHK